MTMETSILMLSVYNTCLSSVGRVKSEGLTEIGIMITYRIIIMKEQKQTKHFRPNIGFGNFGRYHRDASRVITRMLGVLFIGALEDYEMMMMMMMMMSSWKRSK